MQTATIRPQAIGGKKDRIIYWTATSIVMLFDFVGAFWFNSDLAKEGVRHLGFPDYFRVEVSIGKIIGGFLILLPMVPKRLKEWAYVGFGISMISAFIANWAVDGFTPLLLMPVVFFVLLVVSYIYYHKISD
ncbi:DoxX family protein [Sediminibacterium roseum]|uniref:DoxX family protein n=1 Tax=Sediminibacterium roseum TaxID=1978412 RepID=A0ABW9ZYU8_9BACT|nr:DoxX family protein [Sediminibacterium roseum]NCI51223.1 DoxX family protein [Sediminibacterium roseum]